MSDLESNLKAVQGLVEDQKTVMERPGMIDPVRLDQYLNHAMQDKIDKYYTSGWNAALEMAATKLVHDFSKSFGADTCASWAAWLKEQKK